MLEAAGACDLREAGGQNDLQARHAISKLNPDGDAEHCVVLERSCTSVCMDRFGVFATLIGIFLPMSGQMLEEGDVTPSEAVAVWDWLPGPVLDLVSSCKTAMLIRVSLPMSGRVLEEDGVVPSGGVAVRDCTTVSASSLAS